MSCIYVEKVYVIVTINMFYTAVLSAIAALYCCTFSYLTASSSGSPVPKIGHLKAIAPWL
ncbi:hypothetical protein [Nostoc sp.]|uniref:hypothetical protein n=1 Tax=Nostoc sp. TaxID=1180 RepID=UPI002FF6016C